MSKPSLVERLRDGADELRRLEGELIERDIDMHCGPIRSPAISAADMEEAADAIAALEQWKKSHCSCEHENGEIIRSCFHHQAQLDRIAALERQLEEAREVIRAVEFNKGGAVGYGHCPFCRQSNAQGHHAECDLDAALKGLSRAGGPEEQAKP